MYVCFCSPAKTLGLVTHVRQGVIVLYQNPLMIWHHLHLTEMTVCSADKINDKGSTIETNFSNYIDKGKSSRVKV